MDKKGLKASDLELLKLGHFNLLNSKLIIDAWSNFELLVTLLCEKILDPEELERIKNEVFSRVIKSLPEMSKTDDTIENLEYLKKEHIAHSSVPRRYNALFKITDQNYTRAQKKKDRKFLEFFGKLRNCIHSNFIYFGRYYVYQFNEVRFTFENNKTILTVPNNKETIFEIFKMLYNIAERIIKYIDYEELIYDPSYDLM